MRTWKVTLEYDGSKYSGWQEQTNARTVQGALRKVVEEYFGAPTAIQGAGRTDAGVHALAQVAHIKLKSAPARPRAAQDMLRHWNNELPADIAILAIEDAPPAFHARHDAKSRSYLYQISGRKSAFAKRQIWWVKEGLDLRAMASAAALLPGRHDFSCFAQKDPTKPGESTIVVVDHATISAEDHLILFRIEASHFLWKMVRRIVGTLVKAGTREITLEQFGLLVAARPSPELDVAAWTAPASGLFLERVRY
ncbi:MAG: tRNA pseudouridine(38-40) synthase TruA [Bryobacteraceae bacterium]